MLWKLCMVVLLVTMLDTASWSTVNTKKLCGFVIKDFMALQWMFLLVNGDELHVDVSDSLRYQITRGLARSKCHQIIMPQKSKCCKEVAEIGAKMTELRIDIDAVDTCISGHEWHAACCVLPSSCYPSDSTPTVSNTVWQKCCSGHSWPVSSF